MSATIAKAGSDLSQTFLTFVVGDEEYGVEILMVREIVGMLPITPVPGSPPVLMGVANLRGKVVPVVSMRTRFALPPCEPHPHNVIIVVESGDCLIGLAVDRVQEVCSFAAADMEPPPQYGLDLDVSYVKAIGKSQGRIRILLDIAKVLSGKERAHASVAVDAIVVEKKP